MARAVPSRAEQVSSAVLGSGVTMLGSSAARLGSGTGSLIGAGMTGAGSRTCCTMGIDVRISIASGSAGVTCTGAVSLTGATTASAPGL